MVREGRVYVNGDNKRLICLVAQQCVIYQEYDQQDQPRGPRMEANVNDFNGWKEIGEQADGERLD